MVVRSAVYVGENTDSANLESRMQYTYTKGGLVGGLSYTEGDGSVRTYTYTYANDALPTKSVHPDGSSMAWSYDVLRRNTRTAFIPKAGATAAKRLYTDLTYQTATQTISGTQRTTATPLVSTYTNKFGSSGTAVSQYTYTYDNWGNIVSITDLAGKSRTYTYNDFSEIESATENYGNGTSATYAYTYDAGGNILTETINGTTHTYSYDSVWKDKLVSYDGQAITYDQEGHPLSYLGSTMTWDVHNRLSSISGATPNGSAESITYTYLSDGSRRSKTVDGVTTTYHYNNGLLLSQTTGDETIRFYYDSTGKVASIGYQKGTAAEAGYFFARNAQGDIIAVYRSSDSKLIGTYEYDLWGKPVSTTEATAGIDTDGILSKNPLRYRGYYFDSETGFYYLQSRYYDPGVRRFASADSVIAEAGTSVKGYNLFSYCWNNPINMTDETGCWPKWATGAINIVGGGLQLAAGAALGATVSWTGVGAVAAGVLLVNGTATMTQGIGQTVNAVTDTNYMREDNVIRTGVQCVGEFAGRETGKNIAGGMYDTAVVASGLYAGKVGLQQKGAIPIKVNTKNLINNPWDEFLDSPKPGKISEYCRTIPKNGYGEIYVAPIGNGQYFIVNGHHRVQALKNMGVEVINVYITK